MAKKLYKSRTDVKVDGICAGVADYFNMDATLIRIIFALLILFSSGTTFVLYIICMFIIPREPDPGSPIDV